VYKVHTYFLKGCVFVNFFSCTELFLSALILCGGGFFTFYLKGFFFLHPVKTAREMFKKSSKSGISPLRALSASLAGTLGVGNIVGVAVALILGGAGALFWIWASALISMVLKYCEVTLGVKYRKSKSGGFLGGPMYYMSRGLRSRMGAFFAAVFSAAGVVSSFALGNIVQASAASDAANIIFGANEVAFAAVFSIISGLVIFGGFERISRVTSVLLPFMSCVYLMLCAAVILREIHLVPQISTKVFSEAFRADSALGGTLGFLLSDGFSQGVAKGTFSHESGSGTAPMAHANAQTESPARQGLLGLFEVFADTVIMCTLSAYVILIAWEKGICDSGGMALVLRAFGTELGAWAEYVVGAAIVLFAFSTVICWAFYGKACLAYITGSKKAERIYILLYLAFAVFGAALSQDIVWKTADAAVALMTATNMPALFLLRREIKEETKTLF
jgi:AGCS family alanine or glycine:cation symporter